MALHLGGHQIDRQIRWVGCSRLEEARRSAQPWDVLLEVPTSPSYNVAHSCRSGGKSAFQAHEDGLQVVLRLLQGLRIRGYIQGCGNDVIVQGRHPDRN